MMMAIFARHYINDSSCILHKKQLYVDGATNSGKITELGQTCCDMTRMFVSVARVGNKTG